MRKEHEYIVRGKVQGENKGPTSSIYEKGKGSMVKLFSKMPNQMAEKLCSF